MVKLKTCHGRKSQLVVLCQVNTNPCQGLVVIIKMVGVFFCGFVSYPIGRQTTNPPDIFSAVHSFTGKIVHVNCFDHGPSWRLLINSYGRVPKVSDFISK